MKTDVEAFNEWLTSDAWRQVNEGWSVPESAARFIWLRARSILRSEQSQASGAPKAFDDWVISAYSLSSGNGYEQDKAFAREAWNASRAHTLVEQAQSSSATTAPPDQMAPRDHFALEALRTLNSANAADGSIVKRGAFVNAADYCYAFADAMLKRRAQP